MERALEIGRDLGLIHVYAGNVPGQATNITFCPACGKALPGVWR